MRRSASPADDIAAAWVARLDRLGTDERDHPKLCRWLEADSRNRGAFVRARAMWQMMDHDATSPARAAVPVSPPMFTRRAMVAGISAVAGAGLVATLVRPAPAAATILRTGFGEIRRFRLAHGGALVLDGGSHAVLHGAAEPRLDLIAGAIWIDLPERHPGLDVRNAALTLEAAGAALAVRRAPVPEVIVERGFVDLRADDQRTTRIGMGSRVRRSGDAVTRIDQVPPEMLDRLLAWRTGDIDLDGETVAAAAERFNAYNRRRILVADPRIAGERVVGQFALHRPDDFADAVAAMFAGRVEQEAAGIRIESDKKKGTASRRISRAAASSLSGNTDQGCSGEDISMPFSRRVRSVSSCSIAAIVLATSAQASPRSFDVPAQSASTGIRQFARQAGLQIIAPAAIVSNRRIHAVQGVMEVEPALGLMLRGTNLRSSRLRGGTIMLSALQVPPTTAAPEALPDRQPPVDAPTPAEAAAQPPAAPAGAAPPPAEIVVTGSRIARQDYSASSPIVTLGADALQRKGSVNIESALNDLPQFTPSNGQANAFPSRGGQANINLRGLGTNRALVLINGRRAQPSNGDGTIDINTIPRLLIANIETITGGASATYGSDAMAGVVNFKLRERFTGIEVDGQSGITTRGDGGQLQGAVLVGTNFAEDRGNIFASVDYTHRDRVSRADRGFFRENGSVNIAFLPTGVADLSANPPSQAAVNNVFARYGTVPATVSRTRGFGINNDGTLYTSNPVTAPVFNYKGRLDDLIRIQGNTLLQSSGLLYDIQIPLERVNGFAHAEYKLSDTVKLFAQGQYTHYVADVQISTTPLGSLGQVTFAPATNPFIPADLKTLLNSRANPTGDFVINKLLSPLGPRTQRERWDLYQAVGGASGTIPSLGWTWDAAVTLGRTVNAQTARGGISGTALQQLLRDPAGGAGRAATATSAAVPALCDGGLNLFGDQPISASCQAYILREAVNKTTLTQQTAEANVQGGIARLPAGELKFAAGISYRRNTYRFSADPIVAAADLIGYGASQSGGGSAKVGEVYAELLVPLIHDTPFIKKLEAGAGYRYSRYDTIGGVSTYKADLDWTVVDQLRLRGGYSRAVRAPSVGELFAAPNSAGVTLGSPVTPAGAPAVTGDPCDVRGAYRTGANAAQVAALCVAQGVPATAVANFTYVGTTVFATNQGNAALSEEKADTYSIGAVLRSPFATPLLSRVTGSVDYYHIKITNAIGTLGVPVSLSRCFNGDGVSNATYDPANIYCRQISRSPGTGAIANPTQPLLNLASFTTAGIDGQVDWQIPLSGFGLTGDPGTIRLNAVGTYITKFVVQSLPGSPPLDYIGTTGSVQGSAAIVQPRWKSAVSGTYSIGRLSIALVWRHLASVRDASVLTNPASTIVGVPAYDFFDTNVRIEVSKQFELRGGIVNLTGKRPPQVGSALGNTDTSTYDVLGRQLFVAFRAKF